MKTFNPDDYYAWKDEDGTFKCPGCGEEVEDENELCMECEQEDAEWRAEDALDALAKWKCHDLPD